MSLWRHVCHGLRVLTRRASADRDLDDELQHYLDEAVRARVADGMSEKDARRTASREVHPGSVGMREHVRASGWEHFVTEVLGDVRLALRMVARQPLVSCVIVLVIALGSGAVTTIYSAMNALVLRPVPGVAAPETLVALQPMRRNGEILQQTSFNRYVARQSGRYRPGTGPGPRPSLRMLPRERNGRPAPRGQEHRRPRHAKGPEARPPRHTTCRARRPPPRAQAAGRRCGGQRRDRPDRARGRCLPRHDTPHRSRARAQDRRVAGRRHRGLRREGGPRLTAGIDGVRSRG